MDYSSEQSQHLSPTLIRAFAYGIAEVDDHELQHVQDCDECCDLWWKFKVQANADKPGNDNSGKRCA